MIPRMSQTERDKAVGAWFMAHWNGDPVAMAAAYWPAFLSLWTWIGIMVIVDKHVEIERP